MTVISTKSITGVTSITSPQSDDAVTLHTNDTTQRVSVTTGGMNVTGVVTATSFSGNITGTVTGTASGNPTLANGSNNRVITATGANALNGESTLTYDGTTLFCNGGTITAERGAIPSVEAKNSTTSSYARFYCSQTSGSGGYAAFQKLGTTSTAIGGANATQIWCTGDAPLVIGVNSDERLRITSTGWQKGHTAYQSVGINTFASWARSGGAIRGEVGYNAVTLDYMYFGTGTTHPVALRQNNTTALFIDTNKRLLVGAETIAYKSNLNSSADTSGQIAQFVGATDNANHCVGIFAYSGTSNPTVRGAKLQLNRARSTDGTTNTALANGDLIGAIEFKGNDGTSFTQASRIECFVEDTSVAADDMGGRLVFSTTADAGHSSTERLRIDSKGKIIVASGQLHATRSLARFGIDCHGMDIYDDVGVVANYGMAFYNDPTTNKANGIGFFNDDGQTCGGYIVHQDKGGSNIGDLIFATATTANTPVERLRINSKGLISSTISNGCIDGTYVYKQANQSANYEHKIRGPLGGLIDSEMNTNSVAYIKVQCTGTGTNTAYCYYSWSQDGENLGATLTHIHGNSGSSSNNPWMVLDGQHPCWKTAHSTAYTYVVRVEITGGEGDLTYQSATGGHGANP